MLTRCLLLMLLLAFTAVKTNGEQSADDTQEMDVDCDAPETGAAKYTDPQGHCRKKGEEPKKKRPFVVDKEYFHRTMDLKNLHLIAQTVLLQKGPWCVSVQYHDKLGPRLVALLWFQYGSQVAYSLVRSKVDDAVSLKEPARADISLQANAPFTVHIIFVPGVKIGREGVTITPEVCDESEQYVELDKTHVGRVLTCRKDVLERQCRWTREEEGVGAKVADWFTPSGEDPAHERDRFLSEEQAKALLEAWPLAGEHQPERHFLLSDWLKIRARPGCLRLWIYAWGSFPEAVMVHVQEQGSPESEAKPWTLATNMGQVITWEEEHVPVDADYYRIVVEFRGGWGWVGSMVVDDISEEGETCSRSCGHSFLPSL